MFQGPFKMKIRNKIWLPIFLSLFFQLAVLPSLPMHTAGPAAAPAPQPTLALAAVCEGVQDFLPHNAAVVFSMALGKVSCFSAFDPVPQQTNIYHNWYYRDQLIAKVKLALKTPRWSTYSSIQLRQSDIGPWRVEISDQKGFVFQILRFSVTE